MSSQKQWSHPVSLSVGKLHREDIYRDVGRINIRHRNGIKPGRMCRVKIDGKSARLVLRGCLEENHVLLDEVTRTRLDLQVDQTVSVQMIEDEGVYNQLVWSWNASDPAIRIASRLGLVSLLLGLIGLLLGLIALH